MNRKSHAAGRTAKTAVVAALAASVLAACTPEATKPVAERPPMAFPPPPDPARFYYERSVFSSADVGVEDSTSRLRAMVTGERETGRGFGKPFDVVGCEGRIFVSDSVLRVVLVFNVPEHRFEVIGESDQGELIKPLGINVDASCNLYVADASARSVKIYDRSGNFITAIGGTSYFNRLSHVAATPDGSRVFAVDTGGVDNEDHRVRVFDTGTGEHLYDIGGRGKGPGQFNLPRDLELGPDGRLYVVDGGNFRVQVLEQDGTFVRAFGKAGRQFGDFSRPKGIALGPDGNIYVSDAAFGNFQIFTPEGQLLMFVGSRGSKMEPAKYMLPAGIDVDEDGRVYMVDQFFRRLDIFRPAALDQEGGFLGAWYRKPGT
jgi:DNA-binding beta-propeller fold protein YncE